MITGLSSVSQPLASCPKVSDSDRQKCANRLAAWKGVSFPVELKRGVSGSLLCYVAAPDGVSIELMQC